MRPVGSEVSLTIVRNLDEEPFDIVIIRDIIKLTARVRIEDDVIIIRVTNNEQTTPNIEDIEKLTNWW